MNGSGDPRARLDPQLAAALDKLAEIDARLGPPGAGIDAERAHARRRWAWWSEGGPEMAEIRADRIPGPLRDVPVMLYRPQAGGPTPALVFLPGGAFRAGDEKDLGRQLRELAAAWGGVVISVGYAQLPEHVFPAAVEETAAVYRWLAERGSSWGIDGGRLAFGGLSSGANVALGAAIALGGARTGFLKAGVSIVGILEFFRHKGIEAMLEAYVPDPAQRGDPRVDCTAAEPEVFPPMFIAAAELDVLRLSSRNLAGKLAAAGRPHRLKIYPRMTHSFFNFSRMVDRAGECIRDVAAFLRETIPAR